MTEMDSTSEEACAPIARCTPQALIEAVAADPSRLEDPATRLRHEALLDNASVCSFCGVGCPFTVEADARGRRRVHPLSPLGLCVKGRTSLQSGGDVERKTALARRELPDDRIRVPMLRGHDGNMHEASWDEALDRAAWLFLHAREWVGPEAIAVYGNGQKTMEAIWMASLYKLVFGVSTMGANSEHCLTSAGAAHTLNFGNEASFTASRFDELARCDVAVLHGTNAYVTFPQAYEKLAANTRAVKVVIDPTRSDTVSELEAIDQRTLHIRFRQGGDVLFNLSVSRVILENGWQDQDSIDARVDPESFEAFHALCMEDRCEPAEAARRIALPGQSVYELAATIRQYAALIAEPRGTQRPRTAFVSSMGINQSTGSYGFSTNLNLLLLTGNVGREGAGSLRIAGQSNATSELMMGFNARKLVFNLDPSNAEHRRRLAELLDIPEANIPRTSGTSVARMAEDDRLYCFLFVGTQMTKNMPRVGHWSRRLGRSFNIVIDSFLGEGVLEHADVLLPALTYTERTGVIQRGDRTLQLQQQVTEPPESAWSDSQILARLALKIAERLRDPDTAALNQLDAAVVHRTFSRYIDKNGQAMPAHIFDHLVALNRQLDLYSRLESDDGTPISHETLRRSAGVGVQWGSNARYRKGGIDGDTFPSLSASDRAKACLVRPPDDFIARLEAPLPHGTLSLISGRGRPGRRAARARGRYNSGIKTLPIYGADPDEHYVELHPREADERALKENTPIRLLSTHGIVFARVARNERIARGTAFIDFVPGEVNRLTDYVEADEFTHQSLIKRTPVELRALRPLESVLWQRPDPEALNRAVFTVHADWCLAFPREEDWLDWQREAPDEIRWLSAAILRDPDDDPSVRLSEAVGALGVFFQRYLSEEHYRQSAAAHLYALDGEERERFLRILLPLARRLDYHAVLHPMLADIVGGVTVVDADGTASTLDLLSAHKSAVLEFKEEIVAIQLFIAIKRALEHLFGPDARVRRDALAFVSGVAIPCAGDVPAHFLGISPADLDSALLVHSRAIGSSALMVVDQAGNRAVRIDVVTGVLPKDAELGRLRGRVINQKRTADAREHRRFFDRLAELIVDYVREGDANFILSAPVPLDWAEYRSKLAFAPPDRRGFREHLIARRASPVLAEALVRLGVLDAIRDTATLASVQAAFDRDPQGSDVIDGVDAQSSLYAGTLGERVERVVRTIVAPVLANDGGRLDVLGLDEANGELRVRFVGSCANCPYSLLSMEQIVKPTLLAIPGIHSVVHRARAKQAELSELPVPFPLESPRPADGVHEQSSVASTLSAPGRRDTDGLCSNEEQRPQRAWIPIVAR